MVAPDRSLAGAETIAAVAAPVSLDELAGEWVLHDAGGAVVGASTIEVEATGAMLFERRTIGQNAAQPLWFENSERANGWLQKFVTPTGQVREFSTQSAGGLASRARRGNDIAGWFAGALPADHIAALGR